MFSYARWSVAKALVMAPVPYLKFGAWLNGTNDVDFVGLYREQMPQNDAHPRGRALRIHPNVTTSCIETEAYSLRRISNLRCLWSNVRNVPEWTYQWSCKYHQCKYWPDLTWIVFFEHLWLLQLLSVPIEKSHQQPFVFRIIVNIEECRYYPSQKKQPYNRKHRGTSGPRRVKSSN